MAFPAHQHVKDRAVDRHDHDEGQEQLPERDQYSLNYTQMVSRLAIMMGGRVAEELIFGEDKVTSGAASDIEQATRLARAMITRWGFSKELGTVVYGAHQEAVFLGHSVAPNQTASEFTAQTIDAGGHWVIAGVCRPDRCASR